MKMRMLQTFFTQFVFFMYFLAVTFSFLNEIVIISYLLVLGVNYIIVSLSTFGFILYTIYRSNFLKMSFFILFRVSLVVVNYLKCSIIFYFYLYSFCCQIYFGFLVGNICHGVGSFIFNISVLFSIIFCLSCL